MPTGFQDEANEVLCYQEVRIYDRDRGQIPKSGSVPLRDTVPDWHTGLVSWRMSENLEVQDKFDKPCADLSKGRSGKEIPLS